MPSVLLEEQKRTLLKIYRLQKSLQEGGQKEKKADTNWREMDSFQNCNICFEHYGDEVRPRSLSCGHSFCTSCLSKSIKDGTLACPRCQQIHDTSDANDLPINYDLEGIISDLRKTELCATCVLLSNREVMPGQCASVSTKVHQFFNEQQNSLKKLIQQSEETLSQLLEYNEFIIDQRGEHKKHSHRILELFQQNEDLVKHVEVEQNRLLRIRKGGQELKDAATNILCSSNDLVDAKNVISVSDEMNKCYVALEDWIRSCQKQVPDVETVSQSEKVLRETATALSWVNIDRNGVPAETLNPAWFSLSIMDKLERITTYPSLNLRSLQNLSESVKSYLDKGVYAVLRQEGNVCRSAKITVKDGKTYLHCLKDEKPPACALTIEHSNVISSLDTDKMGAFMDLSWEGSLRGRILIDLSPNTPYAQHFRILCTGDRGPSYINSRLFEVGKPGDAAFRSVAGGDYERNDGSGGVSLLSGLQYNHMTSNVYNRIYKKGVVFALDDQMGAQFGIAIETGDERSVQSVFGQVADGIEFVELAATIDDICSVEISECGVVLPL